MDFSDLSPEIVVFDTEYTTWEGAIERGWSGPNEYREIVQIGAVLIDTATWGESDHFLLYVRPVKNPVLSDFFTRLTGISQATVDSEGIAYAQALERFRQWAGERPLYCWGTDVAVMAENAALLNIPFPFPIIRETDIRPLFRQYGVDASAYQSSTIPKAFGEVPPSHAHDALNDARSILQALRALKMRVVIDS